ncbi:MAG: glycosyltransferase family 2 protein [Clostridia bacterium]|nr:glycosyltransferase family 2 protein [Clostridia bacterium]
MTLSVCMIVKDEEATLARCIECAAPFADEIIVVDTGSTDGTVQIARSLDAKVFFFEWCDDFSAARNFSFSKAECDLVMWLDADDVITPENAQKIADLKERDDFDVAFLKYAAAFDGDTPTFVYYRERIFRRSSNFRWQGFVHEVITPAGRQVYSDACVYHKKVKSGNPRRNLAIYQSRIAAGCKLDERGVFYYGRELFFNNLLCESIAVLTDYLKGGGWVENKIEACRTLYRAYGKLGREEEAVSALLQAFSYAAPRAEDCCYLAEYFERKNQIGAAIYWYERALSSEERAENGGFVNVDFLVFIPAIRLCVLHDKLGNYELANRYNEIAGKAKPNSASYLHNKQYFQTKLTER